MSLIFGFLSSVAMHDAGLRLKLIIYYYCWLGYVVVLKSASTMTGNSFAVWEPMPLLENIYSVFYLHFIICLFLLFLSLASAP